MSNDMMDDWSRTAEQIMLSTIENKIRILAITSPFHGAGVTTVAHGLATVFAQSGRKTLLIDLSGAVPAGRAAASWAPGTPLPPGAIVQGPDGLAFLAVVPGVAARSLFNNVELLQAAFQRDFFGYASIVIDLPALDNIDPGSLNPVAIARAADAVFLVAPTGYTAREDLASAAQKLRQVGAPVSGIIMNDQYCATLGEEIAALSQKRVAPIFPRLARWITTRAQSSTYLNRNFRIAG